jgi:hypothetical protein
MELLAQTKVWRGKADVGKHMFVNRAVFYISITLAGRAADPHRPHPCDDDRKLAAAVV